MLPISMKSTVFSGFLSSKNSSYVITLYLLIVFSLIIFQLQFSNITKFVRIRNYVTSSYSKLTRESCLEESIFPKSIVKTIGDLNACGYNNELNCSMLVHGDDVVVDEDFRFVSDFILSENNRKNRLEAVKLELNKMSADATDIIILTVVNKGFLFVFLNWVCSVEHYKITPDPLKSMLILAVDIEAYNILKRRYNSRFHVILAEKLYIPATTPSSGHTSKYLSSKTPSAFGYNWIQLQKYMLFTLGADVLANGNDILMMDVDFVWHDDPRKFIMQYGHGDDFMATHDGFVFARSSCSARIAMDSIIHIYFNDQANVRKLDLSDQGMLIFSIPISQSRYIPSRAIHQWTSVPSRRLFVLVHLDASKVVSIHASWTGNFIGKIVKFNKTNDWFYSKHRNCSFYEPDLDVLSVLNITNYNYDQEVMCNLVETDVLNETSQVTSKQLIPDPLCVDMFIL